MPDLGSTSFSQTDSSNDPAGSAAPNTIDNNIREIKGAVTREWNWRSYTVTAGGTADAKTLTYSVAPAAYYNGQVFGFIANTTNTGSCTVNVNSVGAKTVKSMLTGTLANLSASQMVAGVYVEIAYNTANDCFVWTNQPQPDFSTSADATTRGLVEISTAAEFRDDTADRALTGEVVWDAAASVALTDDTTIAVDFDAGFNFTVTLGGNRTLGQPSNQKVGQSGFIRIIQDGTGSRTLAYHADWKFAGGTDPTLTTTASATDILFYQVIAANFVFASLIKGVA